jgi:hypothetical protein
MAFRVLTVSVDLMNRQASVGVMDGDQSVDPRQLRQVQINFPFDPPAAEMAGRDQAIAEAKAVLRQVLDEI